MDREPGMRHRLQKAGHDGVTELNWTELQMRWSQNVGKINKKLRILKQKRHEEWIKKLNTHLIWLLEEEGKVDKKYVKR